MSKFSVKKPFTVLVMVIAIMIVGGVSLSKMQMDLLPEVSLPYILVITTYPGASPEKVETTVSEPMESNLGTITGVKNVFSYSYENYSMVELEFEDDTDMDSVLVKVSTALDTVKSGLPEECGIPSIMELSTDMMASMYLAVGYDGKDMEELSKFVEENVIPELEREDGVASVTSMGLIEKSVQVSLNKEKVDTLNAKILENARTKLDDAKVDLDDAKKKLEDSQKELDDGRQELIDKKEELNDAYKDLADGQKELDDAKSDFEKGKEELEDTKKDTYGKLAEASEALEGLKTYEADLVSQKATLTATEAAIKAIEEKLPSASDAKKLNDGLKEAKDGLSQLNTAIDGMDKILEAIGNVQTMLEIGTDETLTDSELAAIQALASTLTAAGIDAGDLTNMAASGMLTRSVAKMYLSGYSSAIQTSKSDLESKKKTLKDTIEQLQETKNGLDTANSMLTQYQTEKTSTELEIKVTEGIIDEYKKKLDEMGVSYADIETAKMEAAAGFGSADAQMAAGEAQLESGQAQLDSAKESLDSGTEQIDSGFEQLDESQKQIDSGWDSYNDGVNQFNKQKDQVERSANANQLLTLSTLAQLIYAQNFEMPAGYIDDENDNSWLLKVGDNFASIEEMKDMVLCHMDDIGDVKLGDVADLTIIDNSGTTYTRLNGKSSVILSIFKASTAGTNEVSKRLKEKIKELQDKFTGLDLLVVMDQGDYIDIIVSSVVSNMVIGAALAIVILAIFLRDFMPTLVVAISIPLSVLTSLVAMYFSNISLNMMSLSGMALGIGMLVDNSIVVIENIYRLRGRGIEAPRAAVQGTRQVAGAVVASTLTTVCVFLPMVYTTGLVRELMLPMALTIIFCLMASLFMAMTVVPASASTLLRNTKQKSHKLFDKIQEVYGKSLEFCLKFKIVPLFLAIGLLAISVWLVIRMGIVMIPNMTSNQISASVEYEEGTEREYAYSKTDEFMNRCLGIQGIDSIAVMTGSGASIVASAANDTKDDFLNYTFMITTKDEKIGAEEINSICSQMESAASELGINLTVSTEMLETGSMLGSGLSISIYGNDVDKLLEISEDIMEIVKQVPGYTEISNGQEEADEVLHLNIDKDYAMSKGLSVAQIYQDIAGKITTKTDSVKVTIDGVEMQVEVEDTMDPLTLENLMDYKFEITETDEDGDSIKKDISLNEIAEIVKEPGVTEIQRENQTRYITVTASVEDGYNATLLSRQLQPLIDKYEVPEGITLEVGGESDSVNEMMKQMGLLILMGIAFIYLVMVAQFQSLLSPFIVLFTLPLAFTGGLLTLWATGEQISIISLMGFIVLLGTVVNNGIVFVDYTNQLRIGGMERRDALVVTGKTRMRPILMTAMTTILAEASMIFGDDMGSQLGKGMALVIAGGLAYSTLMTLYIIPVMYDILFKKQPVNVDIGSEDLDDIPDDAKEFMEELFKKRQEKEGVVLLGPNKAKPEKVHLDMDDDFEENISEEFDEDINENSEDEE